MRQVSISSAARRTVAARPCLAACLALAASLAFLCLSGCSRRQPDPVIRLTWWIPYAEDSAEYPTFQTLAETYAERTDTLVDLVSVPWDDMVPRGTASRLSLALSADQGSGSQGPDVWGPVPSTWIGPYATEGQVLVLEEGKIQNASQYADIATLASRWAGQQVALPVLMDSVALIYNRELVPDPPQSFEELEDLARGPKLSDGLTDMETERWALVLPLLSQYHVYPFMDGYGGYIFGCETSVPEGQRCDLGDIGLNNEGSVRGIEFLADLYLGNSSGTPLPEALADRASMHDDAVRLFVEGKAGMLLDGPWVIPQIQAAGIQYGVSAIPELPEGTQPPRAWTLVDVLAANSGTAHPDEATDLMNYLAGRESIVALQDVLGKAPVRRDILRQQPLRENRELAIWYEQAANGVLLPQVPELGYVWAPWARALDEAIPGLKPAQEALDQAVEQIQGYIEPD